MTDLHLLWLPALQMLIILCALSILVVGKSEVPEAELLPSIPEILSLNEENLQYLCTRCLSSNLHNYVQAVHWLHAKAQVILTWSALACSTAVPNCR